MTLNLLNLSFLPDSLKLFLDELLVGKSKGLKMAR